MLRAITFRHSVRSLERTAMFALLAMWTQDRTHGVVTSIAKHSIDVQNANREESWRGGLGAS